MVVKTAVKKYQEKMMDSGDAKHRLIDHMKENSNQNINFQTDYYTQPTYSNCNGSCTGNCVSSCGEPPEPPKRLQPRMVHIGPVSFIRWEEY